MFPRVALILDDMGRLLDEFGDALGIRLDTFAQRNLVDFLKCSLSFFR